uniref:Cytochrome P450 1B1-like n=1 Tax=Petromyzon marinus TaxID=7757 RepID=A0AAJ7T7M0_PETMA|nr:cytochrome P450 1B1-like [Petromyzon marinus]
MKTSSHDVNSASSPNNVEVLPAVATGLRLQVLDVSAPPAAVALIIAVLISLVALVESWRSSRRRTALLDVARHAESLPRDAALNSSCASKLVDPHSSSDILSTTTTTSSSSSSASMQSTLAILAVNPSRTPTSTASFTSTSTQLSIPSSHLPPPPPSIQPSSPACTLSQLPAHSPSAAASSPAVAAAPLHSLRTLPGPTPWPFVGNSLQLGPMPHLTFQRMASTYGPLFRIRLGSRDVVVLNGDSLVREALVCRGSEFAGRPAFRSFSMVSGGHSVAFGGYCELWRLHRRLAQSTLRAFSTGGTDARRALEGHVVMEAAELLRVMMASCRRSTAGSVDPAQALVVAVANVTSALCFGRRYGHDDAEFCELLDRNERFGRAVGAGSVVDVMPWLLRFPNPVRAAFDDFRRANEDLSEFVRDKVRQRRGAAAVVGPGTRSVRDMMDALIAHVDGGAVAGGGGAAEAAAGDGEGGEAAGGGRGGGGGPRLGASHVEATLCDVFGASQDTLSTGLLWLILLAVRHPEEQARVQGEVDRVVGRTRLPSAADRARMPRTEAFVCEVLRYSSFVPVTIPHATTRDTRLAGYSIPRDTVVFVNQWSVNHDPGVFEEPHAFRPARFLDAEGTALDRALARRVMIFSAGRRRCIGEELSRLELFLFTAVMLHQVDFVAPPGHGPPGTEAVCGGLTLKPKPFSVALVPRGDPLGPGCAPQP